MTGDGVRCSVFIATSLDGCIARSDGSLDWLPGADPGADDFDGTPGGAGDVVDDSGYDAFIASVDVIIMGRATYDSVVGFGIDWPYPRPVVVLSSRPLDESSSGADIRRDEGPVVDVLERLAAEGHRRAYVDGGAVVQQFLAADLVDDMTITQVPVLLGDGLRLFGSLPHDLTWVADPPRLVDGMVQTTWRRERD